MNNIYRKYIKRIQDCILATLAFIILSPILGITALLVKNKLGSPVLFKQLRPGLNEEIFEMKKFRSMTDEKDENGNLLPDEIRLTSFGAKLRSTSLDELPELLNIIKGDMAIVGPRPLLVRDMVFMTDEQRKRHTVRPGLTGLAQVSGRNDISWEDKLNYDLEYLDKMGFFYDWKIIFMTVLKVFKKDGITTGEMATAEDLGDYLLHSKQINADFYDEKQNEAKKILNQANR